jgi:L-lactate dehydrogenase complex protein LldF
MSAKGHSSIQEFRQTATIAIDDIRLATTLEGATGRFREHRVHALANYPRVEEVRDHLKKIRSATLANLAEHLETFERNATAAGAQVHWAADAEEANRIILEIAKEHKVSLVAKSKSMATEEIELNEAFKEANIDPIETDLGEWIIQLSNEPPYHIIGPAIHKTRQQVAELFERESGQPMDANDIPALTETARQILRQKFLTAGMGISGANIAVAETGSIVIVTNEGNARMVTSVPKVHVAVMGIEKIAPDWDAAAAWLSLLARSATGQPLSIYTTVLTGPAREPDPDGPEEMHIVLLDNGRSKLVGTPYEEVLQCLRCGACLNICPVYRVAGGHAYGSPYSGPIGAVVSPLLFGLEKYEGLPHASTLCGACKDVCPVRIDLPRMLLELRADQVKQGLVAGPDALAEKAVSRLMGNTRMWNFATGLARIGQRPFLKDDQLQLPIDIIGKRKPPHLKQKSFRQMWQDGEIKE